MMVDLELLRYKLVACWRLLRGKPVVANTQLHLCDACRDRNGHAWNNAVVLNVQLHSWPRSPFPHDREGSWSVNYRVGDWGRQRQGVAPPVRTEGE